MSLINAFCSLGNFMPHGYCYLWLPRLVGLHLISDGLIALAYFIIPFTLLHFIRRRKDLPFNWMFAAFGLFIILCGSTHLMEMITLWYPIYWVSGIIKAFTGIISITVAILLIRLVPIALTLPSHAMLKAANEEIHHLNHTLEQRINERTAALVTINVELQQEIYERQKVEQSLRESEESFRILAETAPQIIWTTDNQGKIIYANQHWLNYSGCTLEELQAGKGWSVVHPDDMEKTSKVWQESIKNCERFEIEHRLKMAADGSYRWHLARATPLKDSNGNIIKWVGTSTDIDNQKRAAAELQEMHNILEEKVIERTVELQKANLSLHNAMTELERSNQELAQFAYVASHDLQEPLRMISSYTQLLQRRYQDKLDQDAHEYIDFAVDGAKRMQQLITALLDYSKLTIRTNTFAQVNCKAIVEQVLANLQLAIKEGHIKIVYNDLPIIQGEPVKIMQLFQNLLSNAIKFRNQTNPEIHIQAIRQDDKWLFSIRDNGIGIEKEYFEKIFIIFQRLHGKQAYTGTGIGLAICKRIVEQHKGDIWVESEPGKGTTFYFTIPINI